MKVYMNLHIKLLFPFFFLFLSVIILLRLVWLPSYISYEKKMQRMLEAEYLDLLGTALAPDLIVGDLARVHGTLDKIKARRPHCKKLILFDTAGERLYPLSSAKKITGNQYVRIEHTIRNDETSMGIIVSVIDMEKILEDNINHFETLQLILLVILFFVTLISIFFQEIWIRKPIQKLSAATTKIANGNYNIELAQPSRDEIGRFSESFDLMRKTLKKRETDLSESENRLATIINNSVEGIITIDGTGEIDKFNKAAENIFGYRADEVIGQNVTLLMPEPYKSEHPRYLKRYLDTGNTRLIGAGRQVQGLRKNGEVFPLWLAVAEIKHKGERVFIGSILDITEQKKAEEELYNHRDNLARQVEEQTRDLRLAKEAAEGASRAKSEFLASMSHEIRTPLNAIIGLTDLTLKTPMNEEQRDNLSTVADSAKHLAGIISDILDFSRIEAGKIELENIDFDVNDLLKSVVRTFRFPAEEKGLSLKLETHPQTLSDLKGDPLRLRQIIVNLLSNAVKFTEKGEIKLRVMPEKTDSYENGQKNREQTVTLRFTVSDTGIGVLEEKKEKIFESFRQAEGSISRKYGGAGLGLAISKRLVEVMKGALWVENNVNGGSDFHFTAVFSKGEKKTADEMPPDAQHSGVSGLYILLAEDNPVNAKMAMKVLGNMGHHVVHVQNGEQALKRLSLQRFDLILMDVEMPHMDGLETTRRIRRGDAGDRNRHTPIIAMTAHALTEFRDKAKQSGMDEFVTKPVDFNCLREIIEKNIKGSIIVKKTSGPEVNHSSPNESPIDRQKALKLIGDDEKLLDELNELFVPHMKEEIGKLKRKLEDNDLKEVARIAHSMKSSAEMIGALPFHRITIQVENDAVDNQAERIHQLLNRLNNELEKIAAVLK